jgi:hypothetical protein
MSGDGGPLPYRGNADERRSALSQDGMSLLDYFAGQALVGLLSDPNTNIDEPAEAVASMAYRYARAMLAERKQKRTR